MKIKIGLLLFLSGLQFTTLDARQSQSIFGKGSHKPQVPPLELALNVPKSFGKTHFILGYTPEDQVQEQKEQKNDTTIPFNLAVDGHIKQVFFSPDDKVQQVLLHLIEQEKESIKIAVYTFTDGQIADALINAKNRGVKVQVVADPTCLQDKFNKIEQLGDAGFDMYIYDNSHSKGLITSLMHNKFIIFGKNHFDHALLWTGSFNLTKSGHRQNQENVVVLDEQDFIVKYLNQFEQLKKRSQRYQKSDQSTKVARYTRRKKLH